MFASCVFILENPEYYAIRTLKASHIGNGRWALACVLEIL